MKKEEKQNYNIASEIPNPHFSGVRLTIFFSFKTQNVSNLFREKESENI